MQKARPPAHNRQGPIMTTEERFTKIENTLSAITEIQAKHEGAIRDLIVASRAFLDSQKETTKQITVMREAEQQNDREVREAQQRSDREWREMQQRSDREWRDAHRSINESLNSMGEKLNALIEIVDHIIRKRNDKP
jgi:uncharacterized damage-inducible protein DinB